MSTSAARAEASLWIVRLHGPQRSPALEAGFQQWLASNPNNRLEFERVSEIWDSVGGLAGSGSPRLGRWNRRPPKKAFLKAAAILAAIGLTSWGALTLFRWPNQSYATAIGEQHTMTLEDGTRVSLNSNSRVELVYDRSQRRVKLERGEAYFEVGRDPRRPFVVVAGGQMVKALGTAFTVRSDADRVAVTLVEGRISVGTDDARATMLEPGERLIVQRDAATKRDKPRVEVVTAWRRGEVILDGTRLADAVAEMNRYNKEALVIDDQDLSELRVSGVYRAGDSASFAQATARMLGLEARDGPRGIHLRRATRE